MKKEQAAGTVGFIPGEQMLRYTFTAEERQQLGQDLAQTLGEQSGIQEDLEAIKAQFKSKLSEVSGRVNAIANKVRSGYEMRSFKVEKRMDLKAGTYTVVRLDTGEVIEERPLYENEKQIALEMGKELPPIG
jgi:hypothetical protein